MMSRLLEITVLVVIVGSCITLASRNHIGSILGALESSSPKRGRQFFGGGIGGPSGGGIGGPPGGGIGVPPGGGIGGPPGGRGGCPLCDSSVYSYCSYKLDHDSCCCGGQYGPALPAGCQFSDCQILYAKSCFEHHLIRRCCCENPYQ